MDYSDRSVLKHEHDSQSSFHSHSLPHPFALDTYYARERKTKRTLLKFCVILSIVVTVIVIGALLGAKRTTTSSNGPSHGLKENVLSKFDLKNGAEFEDPNSYQSLALAWLEKTYNPDHSVFTIMQKYALACFYYSTFKVRTPYTDAEYGDGTVPAWRRNDFWMSDNDVCTWYGVSCNAKNAITSIDMFDNQLTGGIPQEIRLLADSLEFLDISSNYLNNRGEDGLNWMGALTKLKILRFGTSYFDYGGVPLFLGNLVRLEELDMSYTLIDGPIHAAVFANMNSLKILSMGGNIYDSTLPPEIYTLPKLEVLKIDQANLKGNLQFIANMTRIVMLWVDDNPELIGTIPTQIGLVTTLTSLSLSGCSFSGPLPSELGQLTDIVEMWVYNNQFNNSIPTELGKLSDLYRLETQGNQLTGTMPTQICDNKSDKFSGELAFLATDCISGEGTVKCDLDCCDCCRFPCQE